MIHRLLVPPPPQYADLKESILLTEMYIEEVRADICIYRLLNGDKYKCAGRNQCFFVSVSVFIRVWQKQIQGRQNAHKFKIFLQVLVTKRQRFAMIRNAGSGGLLKPMRIRITVSESGYKWIVLIWSAGIESRRAKMTRKNRNFSFKF